MSTLDLVVPGINAQFHCLSCRINEEIGKAFRVEIDCEAQADGEPRGVLFFDMIALPATFVLSAFGTERRFEGIVDSLEDFDGHSVITLVASIAPLGDSVDYRVFPGMSAIDVARSILSARGLSLVVRAHRDPPKRASHLQSFENDLEFVGRILAEEGLFWVPSTAKHDEVRVIAEAASFEDDGLVLSYQEDSGLHTKKKAVFDLAGSRRVASDQALVRAYDFEKPELDIEGTSGDGALLWYELSDDARSPNEAKSLAEIRLGERRRRAQVLEGKTNAAEIAAGSVLTVEGAPIEEQNGRFLVFSVRHEVSRKENQAEPSYRAHFEAVPESALFSPERKPKTSRGGVGTSIVTGRSGQEIAIDAWGRTTMLMRWDRHHQNDEKASAPSRVLEPSLAASAMFPRVGWEEMVAFFDGAYETPIVLGRLYNGADPPPLTLPGKKVETHIGTQTTPQGKLGHFIKISDTAGKEQLSLQSSGNYEELSENDKTSSVVGDLSRVIGGSAELFVQKNLSTGVSAAHSLSVGATRSVTTSADYGISAVSESITAAGARTITAGGDLLTKAPRLVRMVGGSKTEAAVEQQTVFTQGASTVMVGGSLSTTAGLSESVSVGGAAIVKVSGMLGIICNGYGVDVLGLYAESYASRHVVAGGKVSETFGAYSHSVKGSASVKGSEVGFVAKTSLIIKAGGMTIKMTPGSITIDGDLKGSVASYEGGGRSEYG